MSEKNISFEKIAFKWLNTVMIKSKASTYSKYVELLDKQILPCIGAINIDLIDTKVLSDFILSKKNNGRLDGKGGLSAKSIQDILSVINLVLNFAKTENYNVKNNIGVVRPQKNKKDIRILKLDEQARLERYLLNNINYKTLGIILTLYTGLRIGEICALRRKNIDFEQKTINIENTIIRVKNTDDNAKSKTKVIIDTPKSLSSKRCVPIPYFIFDVFKELVYDLPTEAFILSANTNKFIEPRTYENNFKSYLKHANVSQINFHSLRHTFATRAIEAGFDVKTLSEILGHSDVGITLNVYVHSSLTLKQLNMQKLKLCCA